MSSPRYAAPLRLRIEQSPLLRTIFILFFLLCLMSLLVSQLVIVFKVLTLAILSYAFLFIWHRKPELGGEAVTVVLRVDGSWVMEKGAKSTELQLLGQSTTSREVMVLRFRATDGGGRFDTVLWRREQSQGLFRQLQVYLRLYPNENI